MTNKKLYLGFILVIFRLFGGISCLISTYWLRIIIFAHIIQIQLFKGMISPFKHKSWITCIIIILVSVFGTAQAQEQSSTTNEPTIRALIVGISEYKYIDKANHLDYADDDAKLFYDMLLTGAMGKIKKENITLLTNDQCDYNTVHRAINSILIANKVQPYDVSIIYFAGHGDCQSNINGAYLLTYDSPTDGDYGLDAGISIQDINASIQKATKKGVDVRIITDACRSGKLLSPNGYNESTLFLSTLYDDYNHCVKMVSCGQKQSSAESKDFGGGHGVFTYFLVKGLSGYADYYGNRDDKVTIKELGNFVDEAVGFHTKQKQTPDIEGNKQLVISNVIGKPNFKDKELDKIFSQDMKSRSVDYLLSSGNEPDTLVPEIKLPNYTTEAIKQSLAYGYIIDSLPRYYSREVPIINFADQISINKDSLMLFAKGNSEFIKKGEYQKKWDLSNSDYKDQLNLFSNSELKKSIKQIIKFSKKFDVLKLNVLKGDSFIAYNDLGIYINQAAYYFPRPIKDFSIYNVYSKNDSLELLVPQDGKARIITLAKSSFIDAELFKQFSKETKDTVLLNKLIPGLRNVAISLNKEKVLNADPYKFYNFAWSNRGISKFTLLGGTSLHVYPLENLYITEYNRIDTIKISNKWAINNANYFSINSSSRLQIKDTMRLYFDQFNTSKKAFTSSTKQQKIYISKSGNIYLVEEKSGLGRQLKFIDYPKTTFSNAAKTAEDWETLEYAVGQIVQPIINKAVYGNHQLSESTKVKEAIELLEYTIKNYPDSSQLHDIKFKLKLLRTYSLYISSRLVSTNGVDAAIIDSMSAMVALYPTKSYLSLLKADFEKGMQQYNNANTSYRVALSNVPKWSKPSLGLSDVYDLTGNKDSASVYLIRAMKLGRSSFNPEDFLRYYLHANYYDSAEVIVNKYPSLSNKNSSYALELADYYSRTGQVAKCISTIGNISNYRNPSEKQLRIMTRSLISTSYLSNEFKRLESKGQLSNFGKLFYLYNLLSGGNKVEAQAKINEIKNLPSTSILKKSLNLVSSNEPIKTNDLESDLILNLLRLKLYKKNFQVEPYSFLSESINVDISKYIKFINNSESKGSNPFLESQTTEVFNLQNSSPTKVVSILGATYILPHNAYNFIYYPYITILDANIDANWPIVLAEQNAKKVILDFTFPQFPKVLYSFTSNDTFVKTYKCGKNRYFVTNNSLVTINSLNQLTEIKMEIDNSIELSAKLFLVVNRNGKRQLVNASGALVLTESYNKILMKAGEPYVYCENSKDDFMYYNVLSGNKTKDIKVVNAARPASKVSENSIETVGNEVNGFKIVTTYEGKKYVLSNKGEKVGSPTMVEPIELYNVNGKTYLTCYDSSFGFQTRTLFEYKDVNGIRVKKPLKEDKLMQSGVYRLEDNQFIYYGPQSLSNLLPYSTDSIFIEKDGVFTPSLIETKSKLVMLENDELNGMERLVNERGNIIYASINRDARGYTSSKYNIVRPMISKKYGLVIIVKDEKTNNYNVCTRQGKMLHYQWLSNFSTSENTIVLYQDFNGEKETVLINLETGKISESKE